MTWLVREAIWLHGYGMNTRTAAPQRLSHFTEVNDSYLVTFRHDNWIINLLTFFFKFLSYWFLLSVYYKKLSAERYIVGPPALAVFLVKPFNFFKPNMSVTVFGCWYMYTYKLGRDPFQLRNSLNIWLYLYERISVCDSSTGPNLEVINYVNGAVMLQLTAENLGNCPIVEEPNSKKCVIIAWVSSSDGLLYWDSGHIELECHMHLNAMSSFLWGNLKLGP